MNTSAPWWAVPLFTLIGTLAGVLLTQVGNLLADHLRRTADRAARWDKDKASTYLDYQRAGRELLHVRVWPAEPGAALAPTEPLLIAIFRRNEELTCLAGQRVAEAANRVAERAHHLATTIDDIRENTRRGTGGAVDDAAAGRFTGARGELVASLDEFAVVWRRDLGITAPYTAGLDPASLPPS